MEEMSIPVRGKKQSLKRAAKSDGSTILTQNANYSVKSLPSTPEQLRRGDVEYRGSVSSTTQHALAVTHEEAIVWDYTSHASVSHPRYFDLPFAPNHAEPLPLGALVTTGASTDVGLVVISATSGKVTFWESIDRAASLSLFQERNSSIDGSLGSLFSGETVVDIVSADHAGFIVTLSSGRLFQLTLRDAQGKSNIQSQFLRAQDSASQGWLGSIKGLVGVGGWKKDVVAVHTRSLGARGQIQVLSATKRSEIQMWDLDWSGRYEYNGSVDFREMVRNELRSMEAAEMQGSADSVVLLDFAITSGSSSARGNEIATVGSEQPLDLLLLVQSGNEASPRYAMVEADLVGQQVQVRRALPLDYSGRPDTATIYKPRLVMPKPGHTAFVIFSDAVVLTSTATAQDTPEAQLFDSYHAPEPYQDTIYLRSDRDLTMLGANQEDSKSGQASVLAFVKGSGLIRMVVPDPKDDKEALERSRVSAKSKIEQAVFYGALQQDNIIDFSRKDDNNYSQTEVQEAAIAISGEVLRSETPFIPAEASLIESHLDQRARAFKVLVLHLRQNYPRLSQATMWRLMWDAEKVAAAQSLWRTFESHLQEYRSGKKKATQTLLESLVDMLDRTFESDASDDRGDEELVRRWFTKSLARLEKVVPWLRNVLKGIFDDGNKSAQEMLQLTSQADDLVLSCLETVFQFREENAGMYGIDPLLIEDGVLKYGPAYHELSEFWTSSANMLSSIASIVGMTRDYLVKYTESSPEASELDRSVEKIATENPRLIQLCCLVYRERIAWCASRDNDRDNVMAKTLQERYHQDRHQQIRLLAKIGQAPAGIRMAERYRDMPTLTELIVSEMQYLVEELPDVQDAAQRANIEQQIDDMLARTAKYFDRFGDAWANAFFDEGFDGGRAGSLLDEGQKHWQEPLTRYLRDDPTRAKPRWINEVLTEKDFGSAYDALILAAKQQETKLWPKKVELSLSKLAFLASKEQVEASGAEMPEEVYLQVRPDSYLTVVDSQEAVYKHLLPTLHASIDREAELQAVMERYAVGIKDFAALYQLLEADFENLLSLRALSPESLIDVLTLMDPVDNGDDNNIAGSEFFLALQVLKASEQDMPQEHFESLLKLIWKRCFIADDWVGLTRAGKKSDEQMVEMLTQTAPFRTLLHGCAEGEYPLPPLDGIPDGTRYLRCLRECAALFDSHVRPLSPSDCIGAGCTREELTSRFPSDELLTPILHDNQAQDEMLQQYINDRKLVHWVEACKQEVKKHVEEVAEQRALELEEERTMAEGMAKGVQKRMNGSSASASGHVDSHRNGVALQDAEDSAGDADGESQAGGAYSEDQNGEDGDGDVDMA